MTPYLRNFLVIVFFLCPSFYVEAQTDESIINDLFFDLFDPLSFDLTDNGKDTLLIRSRILRTYFDYDSISFERETGLKVPRRIITEWKENVEADKAVFYWNERWLNDVDTIYTSSDTILAKRPFIKCLSQHEEDSLFKKARDMQKIYGFSKILFDDSRENAIFDFFYVWRPGYGGGCKVLIKKVFGKWVIVTRFHSWIS